MTPTTVPATPENPLPMPPHGGDWRREADGSLTLLQTTLPEPPAGAAAGSAAKPAGKKQPPKE